MFWGFLFCFVVLQLLVWALIEPASKKKKTNEEVQSEADEPCALSCGCLYIMQMC